MTPETFKMTPEQYLSTKPKMTPVKGLSVAKYAKIVLETLSLAKVRADFVTWPMIEQAHRQHYFPEFFAWIVARNQWMDRQEAS